MIRTRRVMCAAGVVLAACGGGGDADTATAAAPREEAQHLAPVHFAVFNRLPGFIKGDVRRTEYDGSGDDLLTAGLGQTGLANPVAPGYADPVNPTAAELRRHAIHTNYRAIVDTTAAGGFGTLYGPKVGTDGANDGRIAGFEVLAYSDDGSARENVTLMVQVPNSFDPKRPCIVTATSSGSRGVYGAIATGEWGLKRGCAVAYTDKGTGGAPHDLQNDTVPLIDGLRTSSASAGDAAQFRAPLSSAELNAFNALTPNRFALKHAHSQRNPERDWGRYTLQAIEFAFWALNERYGKELPFGRILRTIRPLNTLVIASSVSNGGGAALAAAEQDEHRLIDGVVVGEPQVQLSGKLPVRIRRGTTTIDVFGRPLFDYTTFANQYGACAALSPQLAGTPFEASYKALFGALAANRCASLKTKGLLDASTTPAQADEALAKMNSFGWEAGTFAQYPTFAGFEVASAVAVTYANAISRASVADNLCGYSFASTAANGLVNTLPAANLAQLFATGNGIPPGSGLQIVNNLNPGFALRDVVSPFPGQQDMNLDGALCLRELLSGDGDAAKSLQRGQKELFRNADLNGKPALIVHGRDDGLVPVNHTSRAYTALNKATEKGRSRLSYIEVTNAQHFDAFIGLPSVLPGFDTRYVPLHVYLIRGLDAMWAHLTAGAALPPSQVLRTTPRGGTPGSAPPITEANVPPFVASPSAADAITFSGNTLVVPD